MSSNCKRRSCGKNVNQKWDINKTTERRNHGKEVEFGRDRFFYGEKVGFPMEKSQFEPKVIFHSGKAEKGE